MKASQGPAIVMMAFVLAALCGCGKQSTVALQGAQSSEDDGHASGAQSAEGSHGGRSPPGADQATFDTPEQAVATLVSALERDDAKELRRLLGPGTDDLLSSGDAVADRGARESFVERFREQHALAAGGPDDLVLQVGPDLWPLPVPLVRHDGRWYFDGAAGANELVLRRIGGNELRTIDVMRGFVAAQTEYAAHARDGAGAGVYARRFHSEPGKQDGLYWKVGPGEVPSPAGPMLAAAAAEGYSSAPTQGTPYHGYVYRMLFAQGPAANEGARGYLVDDELTNGFALLARPAVYGVSGVMTFMVNQDGVVWQRDLGSDTTRAADAIREFNPDASWTPIAPEG